MHKFLQLYYLIVSFKLANICRSYEDNKTVPASTHTARLVSAW